MARSYLGRQLEQIIGAISQRGRGRRRLETAGRPLGLETLETRALLTGIVASGTLSSVTDGMDFNYTIALANSSQSSAAIGTFWYAWVPGADYLATNPISVAPPTGWNETVTHTSSGDGYAIQFTSTGAAYDVQPGNSLNFSFVSADTPASVNGNSVFFPSTPVGTSTVYQGDAAFSGTSDQFVVTAAATLQSIAVTPASLNLPEGETQQFTATGTYSNNTTKDLTDQVTWGSSATAVATISNTTGSQGLATDSGEGPTTITAVLNGVTGSTVLTGAPAVLQSIAVTPASPFIVLGNNELFTATGTFSNHTTQNLTNDVAWSSTNTSVATVSNSSGTQGLATSVGDGTSTISAVLDGTTGSTVLTVTPALQTIRISPANPTLPKGETEDFTATGVFDNGTTENLTSDVTWASTNTATATISNAAGSAGMAQGLSAGTSSITAALEGIVVSTTLTVSPPALVSISVSSSSASILDGATDPFKAEGVYSDGSTQNLTNLVTWASTSPSVATISQAGVANGVGAGSATITANYQGITGTGALAVSPPLVTLTNVAPVIKKHKVTKLVLTFSGGLADGVAQEKGLYRLVGAGSHGSFTAKNARKINVSKVQFSALSPNTVTLIPKTPFALSKQVELMINGNGLQDSEGRLIDGNKDGQQGGNIIVLISKSAVTIEAVKAVPLIQTPGGLAATPSQS